MGVQPASGAQAWARIAGLLFLISLLVGGVGEFFVLARLVVSSDATADNIRASNALFRLGFAAYLVEALCDVGLTLALYVLLRPVSATLALLAAFLRLVSTATFAACALFYVAPLHILGGATYLTTLSPAQLDTLALLSLRLYGLGGSVFMVFYGAAAVVQGTLIARSGYLPTVVGALLALGGLGFLARSFTLVLAPALTSPFLLLPMALAGLVLTLWLLVRGINAQGWNARTGRTA